LLIIKNQPIIFYFTLFRPLGKLVVNLHEWGFLEKQNSLRDKLLKRMVLKADELASLTYKQVDVLRSLFPSKKVSMVSHGFYKNEEFQIKKKSDKIIFCIPGGISLLRRNYEMVLDVFVSLGRNTSYELRLAGSPVLVTQEGGDKVLELLKKYKNQLSLYWYDNYLSDEELEYELQMADVLLSPNNENVDYGITKATGTFFLMLEYGKPTIFPSFLKEFNDLYNIENGIFYYKDKIEFQNIIASFLENKINVKELTKKMQDELAGKYSIHALSKYFHMFSD
jgi:hypothetical protein